MYMNGFSAGLPTFMIASLYTSSLSDFSFPSHSCLIHHFSESFLPSESFSILLSMHFRFLFFHSYVLSSSSSCISFFCSVSLPSHLSPSLPLMCLFSLRYVQGERWKEGGRRGIR